MPLFTRKPLPDTTLGALAILDDEVVEQPILGVAVEESVAVSSLPLPAEDRVAVIQHDLDGIITDWSAGAERLFGYLRTEALGRSVGLLVPADRWPEHTDSLTRLQRDEDALYPDTVRVGHAGPVEVSWCMSPRHSADGRVIGAIAVARCLAESKERHQQYQQAQKMEAFGKLASGIAHDFNNLLTVISGYSEILMTRMDINDPMRDWAVEIHEAGLRAQNVTRQMLMFSRKQMIEPRVLDLNVIVCDTEKMLRRLIGEDILMTTIFAPHLPLIRIDPGQLQQVILNLAVNARDAMPRGGRLTIETDAVLFDESFTELHPNMPPGCYVTLAIIDTGVGMNEDTLARLFEPHFTTKGPGEGTGLGLTTVHDILKQNGGHIEVHSEPGRGSTFRVYFPAAPSELAAHKSHAHLRMIPRGQETILLVEDDCSVRAFARRILETCGYTVLEARDGDDAINLVQSHPDPIHLLLSDVVMPNLGGRDLVERLTKLRPDLRVVLLSGYTDDAVTRHGVHEDDFPFLQKPFTPSALAQKVRDELDRPAA